MEGMICPNCHVVYSTEARRCTTCDEALKEVDEIVATEEPLTYNGKRPVVCIKSGNIEYMTELSGVLEADGMAHHVVLIKKDLNNVYITGGRSNDTYGIIIPVSEREIVSELLKQHFEQRNPELKVAGEREKRGLCPACGYDVKPWDKECGDCGLSLV